MAEKKEEIDFGNISAATDSEDKEMTPDDFSGVKYVKNPQVGEYIEFVVEKIVKNSKTTGMNKEGKEFSKGLKKKDGKIVRYDIITNQEEVYTLSNWEIFFKLLGDKNAILQKYAREHDGKYKGAKLRIKRLIDGSHMTTNLSDLAKIRECTVDEARKYQESIRLAQKEQRLYEISLVQ